MPLQIENFEANLKTFVEKVQALSDKHYAESFPNLTPKKFEYSVGGRYVKVFDYTPGQTGRSVHCFVDRTNGNVLKAAGWKAPTTKHPRGNIFSEQNGMEGVGIYGANYLR